MSSTVDEREITDMFTKFTAAFDYIKQTFVNAAQFAEQLQSLQVQFSQLQQDFDQIKSHNTALDEALTTAYGQRDAANGRVAELESRLSNAESAREQAERHANEWYAAHTAVSQELAQVKEQRSQLEQDHQRLAEAHTELTAKLEKIQALFRVETGDPGEHSESQPRDPATQQWRGYNVA
jgi:chromosome segregation ATPase